MSDTLDDGGGGFWLPSDILMDKENFNNYGAVTVTTPNSFLPSAPSVLASPGTASHQDDFLPGLGRGTPRIPLNPQQVKEKPWNFTGSPKPATLTRTGSWTGRSPSGSFQVCSPPPPATTFVRRNDDVWDLMYAAAKAGQVARFKMNGGDGRPQKGNNGVAGPYRSTHPFLPAKDLNHSGFSATRQLLSLNLSPNSHHLGGDQLEKQRCPRIWGKTEEEEMFSQFNQFQLSQNRGGGGGGCGRCGGRTRKAVGGLHDQSPWTPLQVQRHHPNRRPQNHHGGGGPAPGVKKECAGTGVFLPRTYSNPPDSRQNPGNYFPRNLD